MKRYILLALILFALPLSAFSAYVVDTGTPGEDLSGGWLLSNYFDTRLAQRFALNDNFRINELQGYFDPIYFTGGTASIALYGDGLGQDAGGVTGLPVPDITKEYYRTQITIGETKDWYGASDVVAVFNPGAYWIAFETRENDTFWGSMPDTAPNPLQTGAWWNGTEYLNYEPLNLGIRVSAEPVTEPVPEPSSIVFLSSGVLGLLPFCRRFKKTA